MEIFISLAEVLLKLWNTKAKLKMQLILKTDQLGTFVAPAGTNVSRTVPKCSRRHYTAVRSNLAPFDENRLTLTEQSGPERI